MDALATNVMQMETREPPKNLKVGKQPDGSIIYFAFAARPTDGYLGQILVTKRPGQPMTQVWTGVVHNSTSEAYRAMARLNGCEESKPATAKIRVQCLECGHGWSTSNPVTQCSRCNSVDIEPTDG
jgi:hypothetical protein